MMMSLLMEHDGTPLKIKRPYKLIFHHLKLISLIALFITFKMSNTYYTHFIGTRNQKLIFIDLNYLTTGTNTTPFKIFSE